MNICNYTALNDTISDGAKSILKAKIIINIRRGVQGKYVIIDLRKLGYALKSAEECTILKAYIEDIKKDVTAGNSSSAHKTALINALNKFSNDLASFMDIPVNSAETVTEVPDVAELKVPQISTPDFNDMYIGLRNLQKDVEEGFINEMLVRSIVDFNSGIRITKLEDIQMEIADYKNLLFHRIASFLNIEVKDLYNLITREFNVQDYAKVMSIAGERFNNLVVLQGSLARAFSSANSSNELLNAYNSYALLANFDGVLLDQQGDRFAVDEKYLNKEGRIDKYQLKQKSNVQEGWSENEDIDSTSGQGAVTRALLATIPLLDKDGNNVLHNYVNPGALLSVLDNIKSPKFVAELNDERYKWLVYTLKENPISNLKEMLEILLANKAGLSRNAVNIINSFYDRFFNPTGSEVTPYSLERIMDNWMKQSNAITTYSLLDAVAGSLVRSSQARYLRYEQADNKLVSADIKKGTESAESARLRNALFGYLKALWKNITKTFSILIPYKRFPNVRLPNNSVVALTDIVSIKNGLENKEAPDDITPFLYNDSLKETAIGRILTFIDDMLGTSYTKDGTYIWNRYINTYGETGFIAALQAAISAYKNANTAKSETELRTKDMEAFISKMTPIITSLDGIEFKTTIKNLEGNNLPNSIVSNLATTIQEHAFSNIYYETDGTYMKNPLYVSNIYGSNNTVDAISGVAIRADVLNSNGKIKTAKNLSASELIYMSIVEDFYGTNSNKDNNSSIINIQPATYADKTRSFTLAIDTSKLNLNAVPTKSFFELDLMRENYLSNRGFYINAFAQVLSDYATIFPKLDINLQKEANYSNYVKKINNKLAEITSEEELRALFYKNRINIVEGVTYEKGKNGKLSLNFNLAYKASKLYNQPGEVSDEYINFVKKLRVKLVENLISFEVRFWGESTDNLKYWLNKLVGQDEAKTWIDKYTDELILAKTPDGNNITADYVGEIPEGIKLNPLLEQYLHGYDLLASNARLLLTGPSYAHPNKKGHGDWNLQEFIYDESTRALANSKRNVSIPGSMLYFTQESLFGIRPTYKVAVIQDYKAPVYNIQGLKDSIDAHDGSVHANPITAIIESYALQDSATGMNKKPLVADINKKFGGGVLIKCDTYGIDNNLMRMSQGSDINMESLFRRMCNPIPEGVTFDLTKNLFGRELTLEDILNGRRLFFQKGLHTYEIQNIGKNVDGSYSRTVVEVDPTTGVVRNGMVVDDSPMFIESIYDLWKFLGGAYSKSIGKSGTLEFSNISLEATTNYCLNVGEYHGNGEYPTQKNTSQPLRDTLIDYAVYTSAMKVGATNVNPNTVLLKPAIPLNTMTINTQNNGIQQDLDHQADEAMMTEYSQVLSSIAANGWTTDLAKLAYQDLGRATLTLVKDYDSAVKEYLETHNKSQLYDLIAADVVKKISRNETDAGLSQSVIDVINKELKAFRKDKSVDKTHADDDFKMPFSDANIFSNALIALTSPINSTAIKKKRHGIGCVMNPSYGFIQLYRINGHTYSYDDVYAMAAAATKGEVDVPGFLKARQEEESEQEYYKLLPGDRIIYTDDENKEISAYITTIEEYTAIKNYLKENNKSFKIDVTKPSDLRPQRKYWTVTSTGEQMNIYDLPSVIANVKWLQSDEYKKLKKDPSKYDKLKKKNLEYAEAIQQDMVNLDAGFLQFIDENGNTVREEIQDLVDEPVENVMPSIYAPTFNLHPDDSIPNILNPENNFFYKKQSQAYNSAKTLGDMAFIIANGRAKYITFKEPKKYSLINDEKTVVEDGITYALDKYGNKSYIINNGKGSFVLKYGVNVGNDYEELYYCSDPQRASELYSAFGYTEYIKPFVDNANISETIKIIANSPRSNKYVRDLYRTGNYNLINESYLSTKADEVKTSFIKSLEFVGARIPSQTLQSFLKTKCVSLLKTSNNIVYISAWAQWLEGADFDADKMYLMGYDFNDNGRFMGWSPLFNYSSIDLLHISERFPFPTGKSTEWVTTGEGIVDVTDELQKYIQEEKNTEEIGLSPTHEKNQLNNLIDIIIKIGDNNQVLYNPDRLLNGTEDNDTLAIIKDIKNKVNYHNLFRMKHRDVAKYLNNSSSSRVGQIISNPKNYMAANVPVTLGEVRDAADNSAMGQSSKEVVMENPTSIFRMFEENMEGKDVIAIAATAEKIFFALSQYYNQGVRSKDDKWKECMDFFKQFKLGDKEIRASILANTNFNGVDKESFIQKAKEEMLKRLGPVKGDEINNLVDQSLVISCLLSAATDNAKELILSKINCTTKLASVYMYLITIGVDFQDISKFMTSPPIQMISDLLKNNIFNPYRENLNVKNVIKMVLNGPSIQDYIDFGFWNSFAEYLGLGKGSKLADIKNVIKGRLEAGDKLELVKYDNINMQHQFNRYIRAFNNIIEKIDIINNRNGKKNEDYFKNTIKEFSKIYGLAEETTTLGRAYLSSNQGFPVDMTGKLKFYANIVRSVSDREDYYDYSSKNKFVQSVIEDKPYLATTNKQGEIQYDHQINDVLYGIEDGKENSFWDFILSIHKNGFDFHKFLLDPDYNDKMVRYYNLIKGTYNILDVVDRLPHFKSYLDVSEIIYNIDSSISDKYKLIETLYKRFSRNKFIDDDQIIGLINYINRYLVSNYLDSLDLKFTIKKGENAFINGKFMTLDSDKIYDLSTDDGRATFKYWMEWSVIPRLKRGITLDSNLENLPENEELISNKFVNDIVMDSDKNRDKFSYDFYKCSLNLSSKSKRIQSKINELSVAFNDLFKMTYVKGDDNTNIGNLFAIYNLLVNQNKYGANKLTPILGMSVTNNEGSSILNSYLKSIGENDFKQILSGNFEVIGDDAERALAPIVKKSRLKKTSGNYARVYDTTNKVYELYKKDRNGWHPAVELNIDALRVYHNYYVLNRPNARNIYWAISTKKPEQKDLFILKNLIASGQLNITIKCK